MALVWTESNPKDLQHWTARAVCRSLAPSRRTAGSRPLRPIPAMRRRPKADPMPARRFQARRLGVRAGPQSRRRCRLFEPAIPVLSPAWRPACSSAATVTSPSRSCSVNSLELTRMTSLLFPHPATASGAKRRTECQRQCSSSCSLCYVFSRRGGASRRAAGNEDAIRVSVDPIHRLARPPHPSSTTPRAMRRWPTCPNPAA